MFNRTLEDFLDDISDGIVVGHSFNIATLLGAVSASLGEMVCFLADEGGSYSEKVKVINRIKPQLEQFKTSFQKLTPVFNEHYKNLKMETGKNKESGSTSKEKIDFLNTEIAELYIDLLKYSNEVLALINSVKDFVKTSNLTELLTSSILLKSLSEIGFFNLTIYLKYLDKNTRERVKTRADMLYSDICKSSDYLTSTIKHKVV